MIEDDIEQLSQDMAPALENDDFTTVSSLLEAVNAAQFADLQESLPIRR